MYLILFFLLGAIVASFVGVVVARLYTGHSVVKGRSRCDACNALLDGWALVPILQYVVGRGHARCCDARVAWQGPASELVLGALFVLAYLKLNLTLGLLLLFIALSLLLGLVLYDLMHQILPPVLLWLFVIVAAIFAYLQASDLVVFEYTVLTAAAIAFFFIAMHVLSRGRAMGLADAPLAFALALLVGSSLAFTGLIFSFWIGAAIGICILMQRPHGSRMGVEVPFAPYLALGFLLVYFTQWNLFDLIAVLP